MYSIVVLLMFAIPPASAAFLVASGVPPLAAAGCGWATWLFLSWCFADRDA